MLSPKQEAFCLAYINASNASEAYRAVYSAQDMKPATINRKAFDLLQNGKITARIKELQNVAAKSATLTLSDHLERLRQLSELAEESAQYSAAVKAEELRGKASGIYQDRVDVTNSDGSLAPKVIKIVGKK